MTKLQTKIISAIGAGAVLLSSIATPLAYAEDTIVIQNNGRDSQSNVAVTENNTNVVSQTNTAVVTNTTVVNTNTGGNNANDNDGDVHMTTGNTNANIDVSTKANTNVADVQGCCNGGAEVVVAGNARDTENNVALSKNNSNSLFQTNVSEVSNVAVVNTNTGNNKANDNSGNVHMTTGHTNAVVNAATSANTNTARIGGSNGAMQNPGVSAYILDNDRDSENNIALALNNSAVVNQVNSAAVVNSTVVNANTGNNNANDNDGDVHMLTGNTNADVEYDTMVNFNAADLSGCECMDVFAKIGQNDRDSENNLALTKNNANVAFQTSGAFVANDSVDNANTGNNNTNDNGSSIYSDPHVTSGNTNSVVNTDTRANTNVLGPSVSLPNNAQINFNWDLGLWSAVFGWMASM